MSEPNYKQFILARERILQSEMRPIDPTCIDRTRDEVIEEYNGTWSEYYVIYQKYEDGEVDWLEEYERFEDASLRYEQILYAEYYKVVPNAKGFSEWKQAEYEEFLNEQFPDRKDDRAN